MPKKTRPTLATELCKGCGRCIAACAHHCITTGTAVHPATGLTPVVLELDRCSACGLCIDACPEPYGLVPEVVPAAPPTARPTTPAAADEPDRYLDLPALRPLVVKGTYASAIGALLAGCRHFFGYPITPSTEGAELMARLLPDLDGVFVQAASEVAAINMMYGCGGAGRRCLTFTSSPGFSLMLEGLSYMIGAEVPAVVVDVMRGGPGLGNIGPEQSDVKLACRGLGHGNTHAIVLAPATTQEMLDLTMLAFTLSFRYRNPVVVLADGYLGQMTGRLELPSALLRPGLPGWAVYGDRAHRPNLISSIHLSESDLEAHNVRLIGKYELMARSEQRAEVCEADDADVLFVACNTPARLAKGAVSDAAGSGHPRGPLPSRHAVAVPHRRPASAPAARRPPGGGRGQPRADRGRAAAGAQPRGSGRSRHGARAPLRRDAPAAGGDRRVRPGRAGKGCRMTRLLRDLHAARPRRRPQGARHSLLPRLRARSGPQVPGAGDRGAGRAGPDRRRLAGRLRGLPSLLPRRGQHAGRARARAGGGARPQAGESRRGRGSNQQGISFRDGIPFLVRSSSLPEWFRPTDFAFGNNSQVGGLFAPGGEVRRSPCCPR